MRPHRRRTIVAPITWSTGWIRTRARRRSDQPARRVVVATSRRRLRRVYLTRTVAVALGLFAAVALVVASLAQTGSPTSPLTQTSQGSNNASSLALFRSRSLAAAANPLAPRRHARGTVSHHVRRARVRGSSRRHPRTRHATSVAAIPARYTQPPSNGNSASASAGAPNLASSQSAAPPAARPSTGSSTPARQSSSPASQPAFGLNGVLGPGHSPDS